MIDGALAIRLAGPLAPGQFAQVGRLAQVTTSPSIGVIENLEGIVSLLARLNGVREGRRLALGRHPLQSHAAASVCPRPNVVSEPSQSPLSGTK